MTTPNVEELRKQLQQIYKSGELYYRGISDTTDLLQSQAERIATQDAEIDTLRSELADMAVNTATYEHLVGLANDTATRLLKERDTLRAQLADAELHTKQVERGLDKALAQLEKIAATEPSMIYHGRCVIDCGDSGHQDVTMLKMIARETKLFTRPMPPQIVGLQDVHDAVTADPTLAEIEKAEPVASHYFDIEGNLYTAHRAKLLKPSLNGLTPLFTRPMPAQDVKDAERYRWLREQHWSTDAIAVVLNPKQAVKLGYVCPSDSLLDETIDAAIAKGAK